MDVPPRFAPVPRRAVLAAPLLAGVTAGCSSLAVFDTLVPRDPGARRVAEGIAYGDGPRRKLDVYAPTASAEAARAVIVFFYGGSWRSGRRQDYQFAGRALAAQGFVVVVPDYRLVPEVVFPKFLEDGAAALAWTAGAIARFGGAPDRLVLCGHSAGAYNAAMLALAPRYLADAGVAPGAVRGFVGLAGPYDFFPFTSQAAVDAFAGWPDPAETQPISFAGAASPPALLLHGRDDAVVRPRQAEALAARLVAAGATAQTRLYDGVDHAEILLSLSRPLRGRSPALADLADFARRAAG